jgi:large subunit ribosomal protein L30
MAANGTLRITQRRSASGARPSQRDTLRSLGLRRIGRSVDRQDGPELRGMIRAVEHLVEISEVAGKRSQKGNEGGDG